MATPRTLVVVPRRSCDTAAYGQIRVQRRLSVVLRCFLSGLAAVPDHGATLDDLPPEFFRFPPF
jgi:hypothetical protein